MDAAINNALELCGDRILKCLKFTTQSKIIVWFPNKKCLKSPLRNNIVWNINFITWQLTTQNCLTLVHVQVCVGFFSLVLLAIYFTEKNPENF